MIKIKLNGEIKEIPEAITVLGLLDHLRIQHQRVAVELNEQIVKKAQYGDTVIRQGDSLEVVSFMGGGCETGSGGMGQGKNANQWSTKDEYVMENER